MKKSTKTKPRRVRSRRDMTVYITLGLAAALLILTLGVAAWPAGPVTSGISSPADVQRITVAEARERVERGEAVLYDTRSLESFRSLRLPGAISFPELEALGRMDELATDKDVIFYCT
jgi:hypothetical protein